MPATIPAVGGCLMPAPSEDTFTDDASRSCARRRVRIAADPSYNTRIINDKERYKSKTSFTRLFYACKSNCTS